MNHGRLWSEDSVWEGELAFRGEGKDTVEETLSGGWIRKCAGYRFRVRSIRAGRRGMEELPGPGDGDEMAMPVIQEELEDHLDSLTTCHSLWGQQVPSILRGQAQGPPGEQ